MRILALAAVISLAACAAAVMPEPPEGARLFAENCTGCHGPSAQGDGPLAADLPTEPPDLTRIAARNGGDFPRARVLSTIDGYREGTHPGRVMPEFGASMGDDLVPVDIDGTMTPTPRELAALLAYLESIQQPG